MKPAFWNGKTVLMTGHTGFKGAWLSLWLQRAGANVIGYALPPPTTPSLFEVARVAEGMRSVEGDIRNLDRLKAVFREHSPEIVVHMAAQSLVRYSYQHPVETYTTNVIGTVNVLEAVREVPGIRTVLNVTSDKCYENREWLWGYREDDPMGGHDPYSSSKGCAELVTSAYRNSFFATQQNPVVIASARAGNVIGGGDWAQDRLIPDIIQCLIKGKPAVIRNPNAIRPWQHVLEPLNGYLTLIESMVTSGTRFEGPWNFGPDNNDARPVSWIADAICARWGNNAAWLKDSGDHPHEAHYLKLDCSKARALLDWRPMLPLNDGISRVVDWFKAYHAKRDMHEYTLNEIAEYESRQ